MYIGYWTLNKYYYYYYYSACVCLMTIIWYVHKTMKFSFSDDDPWVVEKQVVIPYLIKMRTMIADLTISIHDVRYRTHDTRCMPEDIRCVIQDTQYSVHQVNNCICHKVMRYNRPMNCNSIKLKHFPRVVKQVVRVVDSRPRGRWLEAC